MQKQKMKLESHAKLTQGDNALKPVRINKGVSTPVRPDFLMVDVNSEGESRDASRKHLHMASYVPNRFSQTPSRHIRVGDLESPQQSKSFMPTNNWFSKTPSHAAAQFRRRNTILM